MPEMIYYELSSRIKNVNDKQVRSALRNIVGTCRKQNMSANETYEYIMRILKKYTPTIKM
jgi:hypothetical protein